LHRKGLVIGILILLLGVNIGSTFAADIDVKTVSPVSFDGNTLYVGGSGPNNYTTIQSAVDNALDGDTVFVYDYSSPYYERVNVNTSINLIGEDKNTTIIDGEREGTVVQINVDNVNVTGFTIRCSSGSSGNTYAGIKIESSYNNIYNNILYNHYTFGIAVWYSPNNEVFSNSINRTNVCISLFKTKYNKIYGNAITSGDCAIAVSESSFNDISYNTILESVNEGIFLYWADDNKIFNNNITHCRQGIDTFSSFGTRIFMNNLLKNNMGVQIRYSPQTRIINNNFINSKAYHTNSILSNWGGNYWESPRIFPKIIMGRYYYHFLPPPYNLFLFRIPVIKIDMSPAQEPYDIGV